MAAGLIEDKEERKIKQTTSNYIRHMGDDSDKFHTFMHLGINVIQSGWQVSSCNAIVIDLSHGCYFCVHLMCGTLLHAVDI